MAVDRGAVSYSGGVFYATGYAQWSIPIVTGCIAGGTSITVNAPAATAPDGRVFLPFSNAAGAFPLITVGLGSLQETVTPTSVSNSILGANGNVTCTVTVSGGFTNAHGAGELITSGDDGIMEAINDAALAGGGVVFWTVDTGAVTLATGGLTTTTTKFVPTIFYNSGASARVTTTITTSANWAVGISGATTVFSTANSTLTAGTTALAVQASPVKTGTTNALTAILFTMGTSNPGAGAIKARCWGWTPVQASQ